MFHSLVKGISRGPLNGPKGLEATSVIYQKVVFGAIRHNLRNRSLTLRANNARLISFHHNYTPKITPVNIKDSTVQPANLYNSTISSCPLGTRFASTRSASSLASAKRKPKTKGTFFFLSSAVLLFLAGIFSLTSSTTLLQLFFKTNNILFGDDINNKIIEDYVNNNFPFRKVTIPGDDSIKLDWSNGFIELNDLTLDLDDDDKFSVKSFKFNINLYKYLFDKNHKSIVDLVEITGVVGKMDTEGLLTHDFHIHNNIKLKDCKVILNSKNSLKIFQLELNKISNKSFLLDLMSCEILSGEFNDSLFTIVERQPHLINGKILQLNKDLQNAWEKISRLQMNKININKLHNEAFDWIYDGDLEFVVDLMIPKQNAAHAENAAPNNGTNNTYLVMDLSMKLYNPRCRVTGDSNYEKMSPKQIKLIAETLNKHLPKQLQQQSNMQIYNETVGGHSVANSSAENNSTADFSGSGNNNENSNSQFPSHDYVVPLNCKFLIDPATFQLKEVCDRVTDEFYMELSRITMKEGTEHVNRDNKWEGVMLGLVAQLLIVGLGTFN